MNFWNRETIEIICLLSGRRRRLEKSVKIVVEEFRRKAHIARARLPIGHKVTGVGDACGRNQVVINRQWLRV